MKCNLCNNEVDQKFKELSLCSYCLKERSKFIGNLRRVVGNLETRKENCFKGNCKWKNNKVFYENGIKIFALENNYWAIKFYKLLDEVEKIKQIKTQQQLEKISKGL